MVISEPLLNFLKLQLQHEKQKFIFIISDGAPCGCRDGKSAEQLVREQVDRGNKLNIQTIAFALDRDREYYVNMYDNIVTCKSDDLQNKLINLLAKKILISFHQNSPFIQRNH